MEPQGVTLNAIENKGINEVWEQMKYQQTTKTNGFWTENRKQQQIQWMTEFIEDQLKNSFFNHPKVKALYHLMQTDVSEGKMSPYEAANLLLNKFYEG